MIPMMTLLTMMMIRPEMNPVMITMTTMTPTMTPGMIPCWTTSVSMLILMMMSLPYPVDPQE